MNKCDKCGSTRIIRYSAKCRDLCHITFKGKELIGDDDIDEYGDYLQPDICLECGKVQGCFPKRDPDFSEV